jgi:hypothetical protein
MSAGDRRRYNAWHDDEMSEMERVAASEAQFAELNAASMTVGQRSWGVMDARGERDGFMVTDPDSLGGGEAGDLNPGQLQVANERGEALGDYMQAPTYTLDEAHQQFVGSKQSDSHQFSVDMRQFMEQTLREMRPKHIRCQAKIKRLHDQSSSDERAPKSRKRDASSKPSDLARQALSKILNLDAPSSSGNDSESIESGDEDEEREVAAEEMTLPQWQMGDMNVIYDNHAEPSSESDTASEADWALRQFSEEDQHYIEERFGKHLKHANISVDDFMQKACPLCTFMDNQHDAIGDRELQNIERFMHSGVGNMDERNQAMLVAFMWNKNIYEPMKRSKKRIFKLTAPMAYAHITKPHRITKAVLKLRDARTLLKAEEVFWASTFSKNPMTQEPKVNRHNAQLALKCIELKWKIIGVDDTKKPFQSASHNINPTKATKRVRGKLNK